MKKSALLLSFLLLVLSCVPCAAFQNEPDNFRGVKWGDDISRLADFKKVGDETYQRDSDKLKVGDATLSKISYTQLGFEV